MYIALQTTEYLLASCLIENLLLPLLLCAAGDSKAHFRYNNSYLVIEFELLRTLEKLPSHHPPWMQ